MEHHITELNQMLRYDSSLGGLKLTDPTANATGTYDFVDTLDLGWYILTCLKKTFSRSRFLYRRSV